MSDLGAAAAAALGSDYIVVAGRTWVGLEEVVDAAQAVVTVPAPTSRLSVGMGLRLGGRRAVVVLDDEFGIPPAPEDLVVTTVAACAAAALSAGWAVAQPARACDVPALIERAQVLLLAGPGDDEQPEVLRPQQRARTWHDGEMAALVASGAATPAMRRLAARLAARGIDVAAVELPLLHVPASAVLLGGTTLGIGGPAAVRALRAGAWPDGMTLLDVTDPDEAALVGAVLAHVPAVPSG